MRLLAIAESDNILSELAPPAMGSQAPAGPAAGPAPAQGATTMAPGQQVQQDPQAMAKMMAQQALDRQNQKKEIQDQIKQKQEELQDLQKQLAAIK
jgi:hypothetical protein